MKPIYTPAKAVPVRRTAVMKWQEPPMRLATQELSLRITTGAETIALTPICRGKNGFGSFPKAIWTQNLMAMHMISTSILVMKQDITEQNFSFMELILTG